jgi:ornithine carbamoyltransferase
MAVQPGTAPRHFLDLHLLPVETLRRLILRGIDLKKARAEGKPEHHILAGRSLALIFEKPSTRTRVSFDLGMQQLGGITIMLTGTEMQLGRGETIGDTARVLSRYVDAIMIRTLNHAMVMELAANAAIPVINGLTKQTHPCQVMADLMTFEERKGPIAGKIVAWTGDSNNVLASWMHAAAAFDFTLRIATPEEFAPPRHLREWAEKAGARIVYSDRPEACVEGADCVITDTWVSLGDEGSTKHRHAVLKPYQVTEALMARADRDAIFLHCLPAHRNEEVTDAVIDGPQSAVWDEAENRLHVQKAILEWCLA